MISVAIAAIVGLMEWGVRWLPVPPKDVDDQHIHIYLNDQPLEETEPDA